MGVGIYTGERRGDLLRLDLPAVRKHVGEVLADFPQVAGAYLFGSALEFVRRSSDIDVAVLFSPSVADSQVEFLAQRIEDALGYHGPHPFRVTVLMLRQLNFSFGVLRDGEIVFAADQDVVTDFIEDVGRRHEDLEPFRRTFREALGLDV